jgi:CheY-like chemotaxis protein
MNAFSRDEVVRAVPYARRYGRALSGSQQRGDALVAQALQTLSSQAVPDARLALYAGISAALADADEDQAPLSVRDRQLLLLTALEELSPAEAGQVLGIGADAAETAVTEAREKLREAAATDVLVIEDEPIIAMDITQLVRDCGHRVAGVAATEAEAVALAEQTKPGLILADVNLGSGGDGTAAVARILESHSAPVVFVTAYPERLLTGAQVEPTFVVTKPFDPLALAITTYQATQPRKLAK